MKQFLILLLMCCTLSSAAKNLYYVELKIWKVDNLSLFNLKNERNAVSLELPLDKDIYASLKAGDVLQNNDVYKSAFSFFPSFFKTFRIQVVNKRTQKLDDTPETADNHWYMVRFRSQKYDTFSLNLKNARNAIIFELPVDKTFYDKIRMNQKLQSRDVYQGAFDIIPELFSEISITVEKNIPRQKTNSKPSSLEKQTSVISQNGGCFLSDKHKQHTPACNVIQNIDKISRNMLQS